MKFTVERKPFLDAITNVARVIPTKATMQILEGIKIDLDGNTLTLTGYDLKIGMQTTVDAASEDRGSFVVTSKLFTSIIKKMSGSKITVDISSNNLATIISDTSTYEISVLDVENYPSIPYIEDDNSFEIETDTLKNMISKTVFAVSKYDVKPVLKGELFEINDGKFSLVALDGFRLAIANAQVDTENNYNFIVKAQALQEVMNLADKTVPKKKENITTTISVTKKFAMFGVNGYTIHTRLIDGEFFNYKSSIPHKFSTKVEVSADDLYGVLDRCDTLIVDHAKAPIKCEIGIGGMEISIKNANGSFKDKINTETEGTDVTIGFNNTYLMEMIKASKADTLILNLNRGVDPMWVTPKGHEECSYLVLPVRLKG